MAQQRVVWAWFDRSASKWAAGEELHLNGRTWLFPNFSGRARDLHERKKSQSESESESESENFFFRIRHPSDWFRTENSTIH